MVKIQHKRRMKNTNGRWKITLTTIRITDMMNFTSKHIKHGSDDIIR